jgi:phenylacetate-CoA ligase
LAQYLLEGRDLSLNRTRVRHTGAVLKNNVAVERTDCWMPLLGSLIKTGANKEVQYSERSKDVWQSLVHELKKDEVGYLAAPAWTMDALSSHVDLHFLKTAKAAMWISQGEAIPPKLAETFAELGIPIRATYSSEEVGLIGAECSKLSGYYHVATSNVLVEVIERQAEIDGVRLGRVLVTHLHSYATPFIRYDLGDLACLSDKCPCGHNGPTIHNLNGRVSSVLKHRDGRLSPFHILSKHVVARVPCTEYRIRQTAFDRLVIEFGGRSGLHAGEISAITSLLKERTAPEIDVEVRACEQLDWGQSRKRLVFRCEI